MAPDLRAQGWDLDDLAAEIVSDYAHDKEARSGWAKIHGKWIDLYYQQDLPVSKRRWTGASNASIPILAEACNQFHTRTYQAMFGPRQLVRGRPVGRSSREDVERGERIGAHMTWQLTVQDRNYRRGKDKLLLALPLHGSVFTKTFRDPYANRNRVENVRALDLYMPYGTGPRPLEEVERKTELIWISTNATAILAKQDYFTDAAEPFQGEAREDPDISIDRKTGIEPSQVERDEERPALLLECHRLLDLDNDGIREPYIVTVDAEAQKVLRIAIRHETDELGNPSDGKRPLEYYSHYTFLENPDGLYGLGLGHLLGPLNQSVNKLLRQIEDAATLATVGNMSGFMSQALAGAQGGELEIEFGKFKKVAASVEDINRGIYTFKFPGPQPALLDTLTLLMMRADRLGTITEGVTGQMEKVVQPTTVLALLEESGRTFSAVAERVIHAWTDELQKLARLNRIHMDPEEYFTVLDANGQMANIQVARDDYGSDLEMQVLPTVDPQQKTERERLQKAQIEYETMMTNPLTGLSPIHLYNVTKRYLRALRVEDIDEVLPHPMQLPQAVQEALMEAMLPTTDEAGLSDAGRKTSGGSQSGGAVGVGADAGNALGLLGLGQGLSTGRMENGSGLGGSAPGSGAG